MRTLERSHGYERLATAVGRIAYAYGFAGEPVQLSKKSLALSGARDAKAASLAALLAAPSAGSHAWGFARGGRGTVVAFAVLSPRAAIASALAVKTALAVAESAGYADLAVLVSSSGDAESKRRFARELGNFFRKNADAFSAEVRHLAARDPEAAYRALVASNDGALPRAPRSIDHLSENSRKHMLAALSLFESVGIPYAIEPRLSGEPGAHSETLFALEGTDRHKTRCRIAFGGRFEDPARERADLNRMAIGISIEVPERIDCAARAEPPECFVVHVGDAAKLKAFAAVEALWRAHVAVGQALMAETLREQVVAGTDAKTAYLAIIGQREALDGTVIVRNTLTQLQAVLPVEKLAHYVSRGRKN